MAKVSSLFKETLRSTQFINFDFGKEWYRIVPYLEEFKCNFGYESPPAQRLASTSNYFEFMIDIQNDLVTNREKSVFYPEGAMLPPSFWETLEYYWSLADAEDTGPIADSQISSLNEVLMTACGYNFLHNPEFIAHWVLVDNSHIWNSSFSLFMAQKLFPSDKWEIYRSSYHTTVLCIEKVLMFDPIAWGLRGACWDYVNFVNYGVKDPFLGADLAMNLLLKSNNINC